MKKFLKIILIILLILLVLPLFFLAGLKISNNCFMGKADPGFVEYLENNKKVFRDGAFFAGDESYFGESLAPGSVILLGEVHGYAPVQEIDGSMVRYLNGRYGVRYYLAETDSLGAGMLNVFLRSADRDTALLREYILRQGRRIPQQAGRELFGKWNDLYDYNRSLPDSLKITVFGIDKNVDSESPGSRDSVMFANFADIVSGKKLQGESFYGFFGLFHVMQYKFDRMPLSLAGRMKDEGYGVESIGCFDIDSRVYMPPATGMPTPPGGTLTLLGMDGPIFVLQGVKDLKKASEENSVTLFRLNGEDSPYFQSPKLTRIKTNFMGSGYTPSDPDAPATGFMQHVVFLCDAGPVTPME